MQNKNRKKGKQTHHSWDMCPNSIELIYQREMDADQANGSCHPVSVDKSASCHQGKWRWRSFFTDQIHFFPRSSGSPNTSLQGEPRAERPVDMEGWHVLSRKTPLIVFRPFSDVLAFSIHPACAFLGCTECTFTNTQIWWRHTQQMLLLEPEWKPMRIDLMRSLIGSLRNALSLWLAARTVSCVSCGTSIRVSKILRWRNRALFKLSTRLHFSSQWWWLVFRCYLDFSLFSFSEHLFKILWWCKTYPKRRIPCSIQHGGCHQLEIIEMKSI